jgi:hypothetical protein
MRADRRWPLLVAVPLAVAAVVVGALGYDVLELAQYTIGCLLGIVTAGLWVTVRRRHRANR